jgi:hypothetical protein
MGAIGRFNGFQTAVLCSYNEEIRWLPTSPSVEPTPWTSIVIDQSHLYGGKNSGQPLRRTSRVASGLPTPFDALGSPGLLGGAAERSRAWTATGSMAAFQPVLCLLKIIESSSQRLSTGGNMAARSANGYANLCRSIKTIKRQRMLAPQMHQNPSLPLEPLHHVLANRPHARPFAVDVHG